MENDTTSSTAVSNLNELNKFSRPLMTITALLLTVFMVVGLIGNAITIAALLRSPRVRNVTTAFIISLCVADFSFCLLVLPFEISRFAHGAWIHGDGAICVLFPLLRYWNVGNSLMSITMITVNRFVMIAFSEAYQKIYQWRWVFLQIAFIWLYSFSMLIPSLAGKWGRFGYHPRLLTCTIVRVDGRSAKIPLFILGFVLPCVAICICYVGILIVVVRSDRRLRSHSERAGNTETPQQKKSATERRRRSEARVTRISLAVFLTFVVCYLPVTIAKVKDPYVNYPGLHILGYILVYLSACINPIIYVTMSKQYRQAYKTLVFCRRPRLLSASSCSGKGAQRGGTPAASKTMQSQLSITEGSEGHRSPEIGMNELMEVFDSPAQQRKQNA